MPYPAHLIQGRVFILLRMQLQSSNWQPIKLANIFILVINQLDAQNFVLQKFISCLYMF